MKISTVNKITQPGNVRDVELRDVLMGIKMGVYNGQDLKAATQAIQNESSHDRQNQMKKEWLPCALFNGTFSYKNDQRMTSYSCITAMDFDNFQSPDDMAIIMGRLASSPCVISVFVSPSGKGLKALVWHDNTNPAYHKELYEQLLKKFQIQTATNDPSCSDLSRGNYLCYDPNILVKSMYFAEPYHFVHTPNYMPKSSKKSVWTTGVMSIDEIRKRTETIILASSKKSDASIISIMNACWKKKPDLWRVGNRANSVFSMASQLCKFGVRIDNALDYLKREYIPTGLNKGEIEYQTCRGYQNNIDDYGKDRSKFDNYGSRNKK